MHRIDGAGHVGNMWVPENLATNRPPTEITADWMNDIQESLCGLVLAAGLNLEKNNYGQVLAAIQLLISGTTNNLVVANTVGVNLVDWNALLKTGFYRMLPGAVNGIPGLDTSDAVALVVGGNYGTFQIVNSKAGLLHFRSSDDNLTWSPWQQFVLASDLEARLDGYEWSEQLNRGVHHKSVISVVDATAPYVVKAGDYTKIHRANVANVVFDCSSLEPGKTYTFAAYQYGGATADLDFGPALKWISAVDLDTQKRIRLVDGQCISVYCISVGYYMVLSGSRSRYRNEPADKSYFYEREDNGEFIYYRKVALSANTTYDIAIPAGLQGTDLYRVTSIVSNANTDSAVTPPHVKARTNTALTIRNANAFTVTIEFTLTGLKAG